MTSELPKPATAHLLIVDDNPQDLRLLVELLRASDFRISVAFDGMQAYQRALAKRPDLILMDVQMPIATGFAACRRLQSDPATRDIPVIFLTSSSLLEERLEGLECGAVDYVLKPFDAPEVLARIGIHLALAARRSDPATRTEAADASLARHANFVTDYSDTARLFTHGAAIDAAPVAEPAAAPDADRFIVEAAKQYLATHLANPPRRDKLAKLLGTYEKKLSQAFLKVEGVYLYDFIRDERLRVARRLLTDTSLPITAIADEVGFSSGANFATAFREKFGVTPTAFRGAIGMSSMATISSGYV